MSERFKVGDKVVAVRECAPYYNAGSVGVVSAVHDSDYQVEFDKADPNVRVNADGCSVWWVTDLVAAPAPVAKSKPLHRANDPATSKGPRKVNKYEQAVLSELETAELCAWGDYAGMTGKEIALRTGHPLNCITPRFAPLRRKGLIKAAEVPVEWGENRLVPRYVKRDKQIVWVLV